MAASYTEADYENSVIELFKTVLGYRHLYGPDTGERNFYSPLLEEELKKRPCPHQSRTAGRSPFGGF